jgi:hypothetical protein
MEFESSRVGFRCHPKMKTRFAGQRSALQRQTNYLFLCARQPSLLQRVKHVLVVEITSHFKRQGRV